MLGDSSSIPLRALDDDMCVIPHDGACVDGVPRIIDGRLESTADGLNLVKIITDW